MNLTEEQKEKHKKLWHRFILNNIKIAMYYICFLFIANFFIILINNLHAHNQLFLSAAWIGTLLTVSTGWRGSIQEAHDIFIEETEKLLNNQ